MKLRNKKTGQIGNFIINKDHFECVDLDYVPEYRNLAELNEEWEDYEEPKEFYFIDQFMSVSKGVVDDVEYAGRNSAVNYAKKTSNNLKTAGNYFETREEAEKAVEKLKAWKRLKDKGFRLDAVVDTFFCIDIFYGGEAYEAIKEDLKIVFGGEE